MKSLIREHQNRSRFKVTTSAFNLGRKAFQNGKPVNCNPYKLQSKKGIEWIKGWRSSYGNYSQVYSSDFVSNITKHAFATVKRLLHFNHVK